MIKKIILKNTNTLDPEKGLITINFSSHLNVIIGPKGGGKSTLFDLVASLKKGYISQNVIDALKSFNLEFQKAIKFNGEEILMNQLSKKKITEKDIDFKNRNDVIYQDDAIKKNLNSSSEIDDGKLEHAKKVIETSKEVIEPFINKIYSFYSEVKNIVNLNEYNQINWSNTFILKKIDIELNIISKLNYDSKEIKQKISDEIIFHNKILNDVTEDLNKYKSYMPRISSFTIYNDEIFNSNFTKQISKIIEETENFKKIIHSRIELIKKINRCILSFEKVYNSKLNEIKQKDFESQGLKTFENQAREYFKDFARKIICLKKDFNYLLKQPIEVNFSDQVDKRQLLSYKIDDKILIDEDVIIKLLKNVLHTPKATNDISKWITTNQKENKEFKIFDDEKLKKTLAKEIKQYVKVYADGIDYETMSLGQRSIYGIKYKFERSIDDDLFLDQPEDNLDNETIKRNIVDMINSKNNNQVFIVTHNANIGILVKPEKVIVANLSSDTPYIERNPIENKEENDLSAKYLEGGVEALEDRYKIVVKGEK